MELFSSPWILVFITLSIVVLIYLVINFFNKTKKEVLFYEKLRSAGIFPTIRKPPKPKDLKESNSENDNHP